MADTIVKKKPENAYDLTDSEDSSRLLKDAADSVQLDKTPVSMDIEADKTPPPPPKDEGYSDQDKAAAARMFTGAAPALMGMLFGASPLTAEDQIQQGQKFYENGTPKKLGTTVDPVTGKPIYEDIRNLPGREAYQKPMRPSAGGLPKASQFYNPRTKQVEKGSFNPLTGQYSNAAMEIIPDAQEYIPAHFMETTDEKGNHIVVPMNSVSGEKLGSPTKLGASESSAFNQGPEQFKTTLDIAKNLPKEIAPLQQKINNAKAALNLLASPDAATQKQGSIQGQQILEDAKVGKDGVTINMPQGFFEHWSEVATRAATGKASVPETNGLIAALQQVASAQNDSIASIAKTSRLAAGPNSGPYIDKAIAIPSKSTPTMPKVPANQHPQTGLMIKKASNVLVNPKSSEEDKANAREILKINGR